MLYGANLEWLSYFQLDKDRDREKPSIWSQLFKKPYCSSSFKSALGNIAHEKYMHVI